jgi:hypothetical protein
VEAVRDCDSLLEPPFLHNVNNEQENCNLDATCTRGKVRKRPPFCMLGKLRLWSRSTTQSIEMRYIVVFIALCLIQLHLPAVRGHARLVCPRPRSDSASLKSVRKFLLKCIKRIFCYEAFEILTSPDHAHVCRRIAYFTLEPQISRIWIVSHIFSECFASYLWFCFILGTLRRPADFWSTYNISSRKQHYCI